VNDALYSLGVIEHSSLFKIEIEDGGAELEFPGYVSISVPTEEGELHLSLVRDIQ
jgi:hypothetical protein